MLWQVYYYYVPLYLDELLTAKYGSKNYANIIGHIMSLDNLAAILIIPLFGFLSDRTKTKMGRRMPYIIWGAVISLILFPLIAVMFLLNAFVWYFMIVILLVFAMASWRAPAVSLMPDITPKPLRINANAVINFIGYVGAILGGGLTLLFAAKKDDVTNQWVNTNVSIIPFIVTAVVLMVVIVLFLLRFFENKVVAEMKPQMEEGERQAETISPVEEGKPLSKQDKINFGIVIAAVFFCWFAFNALQSFGSIYGDKVLIPEGGTNLWGICTIILAVSCLITFLPSIWLSKKIGRKWSVIAGLGIVVLAVALAAVFVSSFGVLLYVLLAVCGIGFAIVMVNSYPMVVEMATAKNLGVFTGIYYFASQGAMFLTSNISGYVFKYVGYHFYFYYALIFMSIALVICFFYRQKRKV